MVNEKKRINNNLCPKEIISKAFKYHESGEISKAKKILQIIYR